MTKEELQLGADVHQALFQAKVPEKANGMSIATFSSASKEINGDFFDFYGTSPSYQDLVFGDVMGKGTPAAFVGAAIKMELNRYANSSTDSLRCNASNVWEQQPISPTAIMQNIQHKMARSLIDLNYFSSLFYSRFDFAKQTLSYIDCGAPKPLLLRKKRNIIEELSGENFPLGMIEEDHYKETTIRLQTGDLLLFFSDGITESKNNNKELFGTDRIKKILFDLKDKSPKEIIDTIIHAIYSYTKKRTFEDDVTLIALRCEFDSLEQAQNKSVMRLSSTLDQLPELRNFIEQQCVNIPENKELTCQKMQLAANEAFCNIVEHGYGNKKGEIIICLKKSSEGLTLEIKDQSQGFDPLEIPPPNLGGEKERGYGLHMIKQLADNLSYHRSTIIGGWNHMYIYKKYEPKVNFDEI